MAETTKIEWADATVNPWWGCTKVSPACANCYAETWARRWGKRLWGPGAARERKVGAEALARKLNRQAEREGRRLRVFSASMSDWLDPEVPAEWLADLLGLVAETPHLDWLLLSKRPHLWRARLEAVRGLRKLGSGGLAAEWLDGEPPPNVWVGCTVEDQEHADRRIPELLAIPARVRFLSCEPLLGPVDLERVGKLGRGNDVDALRGAVTSYGYKPRNGSECGINVATLCSADAPRVHWIIAGGESGRGARPSHPDWFRSLRDQAQAAGVAFFFKQHGDWANEDDVEATLIDPWHGWHESSREDGGAAMYCPTHGHLAGRSCTVACETLRLVGKKHAGRLLDGRTWDELPEARP